jgi:hypothetical protein
MTSSRTASSSALVRAAIVFLRVEGEQVISQASIVLSIIPVVMLRTRSFIAPR